METDLKDCKAIITLEGVPVVFSAPPGTVQERTGLRLAAEIVCEKIVKDEATGVVTLADYVLAVRLVKPAPAKPKAAPEQAPGPQTGPGPVREPQTAGGAQFPTKNNGAEPPANNDREPAPDDNGAHRYAKNEWRPGWRVNYGQYKDRTLESILADCGPEALFPYRWRGVRQYQHHIDPTSKDRNRDFAEINRTMVEYIDRLLRERGVTCPPEPPQTGPARGRRARR